MVSAEGFVNLVGVPGLENAQEPNMQAYVESLMRIAIIAAALIAVLKLILAGAKYVLSDLVTDKESAKSDIRSALVGLLIVLAAVTILRTINPDIVNLPTLTAPPLPEPTSYVPPIPPEVDSCANINCADDERMVVSGNPRTCTCEPRGDNTLTGDEQIQCINSDGYWYDEPAPGVCFYPEAGNELIITDPAYVDASEEDREFICRVNFGQQYIPAETEGEKGTCVCATADARCIVQ